MHLLPNTADRVEQRTHPVVNYRIKRRTSKKIASLQNLSREEILARLRQLDAEWDTERTLETCAAIPVLASTVLGYLHRRWWFAVGGVAGLFLLTHALQGWSPPLPLLRRLGIRTPGEIDRERAALRILRGDFERGVGREV